MKTSGSPLPARIATAVARRRYRFVTEKDLQEALVRTFEAEGFSFEREVRLGKKDVVDFMLGSVAVEVKIKGSPTDVLRQILRYLEYPRVSAIVLVTGKSTCARGLPAEAMGKSVLVVPLWKGFL